MARRRYIFLAHYKLVTVVLVHIVQYIHRLRLASDSRLFWDQRIYYYSLLITDFYGEEFRLPFSLILFSSD